MTSRILRWTATRWIRVTWSWTREPPEALPVETITFREVIVEHPYLLIWLLYLEILFDLLIILVYFTFDVHLHFSICLVNTYTHHILTSMVNKLLWCNFSPFYFHLNSFFQRKQGPIQMSSRDYGTYRLRPPPPPPRRTCSSRDTSPDSGLSVSSTYSIPSTSLEAASVTEQSHEESAPMTKPSYNDSQLLEDICSSLDSSTLTVLSLPTVNSKADKLRTNSHSLNDLQVKEVNKLAPQKPPVPVRRDSLRLERRQSNRAKLEDRFSFRQEDVFPPPPPFTNCPKTFPTKELFGVQSPIPEYKPYQEEHKVETLSNQIINAKPKSKKSDGTFFSKIFPSIPQSEPLQITMSDVRYEMYDMYDNLIWQLPIDFLQSKFSLALVS